MPEPWPAWELVSEPLQGALGWSLQYRVPLPRDCYERARICVDFCAGLTSEQIARLSSPELCAELGLKETAAGAEGRRAPSAGGDRGSTAGTAVSVPWQKKLRAIAADWRLRAITLSEHGVSLASACLCECAEELDAALEGRKAKRTSWYAHEASAEAADYAAKNPLGGPASMFRAIAERIEAGEEYWSVLDDYGIKFEVPRSGGGGAGVEERKA